MSQHTTRERRNSRDKRLISATCFPPAASKPLVALVEAENLMFPETYLFGPQSHITLPLRKRMRLPSLGHGSSTNVTFQQHNVSREERAVALGRHDGYRGCTIWFTGLSGAGKTTIAFAVEKTLTQLGIAAYGLDGDNVRHGLCKNLGFTKEERAENIRRVAEVAKLFADMGAVCLASFISPFATDREEARRIHAKDGIPFFEVHVSTALEICEARDPKHLYKKARFGEIRGFTGIDSAYEVPTHPDLTIDAGSETEQESTQRVLCFLGEHGIIPPSVVTYGSHALSAPGMHHSAPGVRELFVEEERMQKIAQRKGPAIELTLVDLQWLQVLAEGWATPLTGFMRERQYLQCLHHGQLFDLKKRCADPLSMATPPQCPTSPMPVTAKEQLGDIVDGVSEFDLILDPPINQSIPIVLAIDDAQKALIEGWRGEDAEPQDGADKGGKLLGATMPMSVRLLYQGKLVAVLEEPEIYPHRKEERIHRQFGCSDRRHPTIKMIDDSGNWLLGGDLLVLHRISYGDGLDDYRKTPTELRQHFAKLRCDAVFAFQLRNPIHNGHALLMRATREQLLQHGYKNPMLLLHPLGGWTKDDDVPLDVRIRQHEAILTEGVLDPKWTVLAIFPSPMLYAGPTEVQWHARARLACGITAYIVGRDPAGIQDPANPADFLYDPSHGAKVLTMAPGLSNLEVLPFRVAAYDKRVGRMAFYDEKRKEDFLFISGTAMRSFARSGQSPPDGFMAPKAWQVLSDYYQELAATSAADKDGNTEEQKNK